MKTRIIFYFLSFLFFPALSLAQTTQQLTPEQETWISKANRHEKNGWLYLHIEGNPEERGFQYGYLLANEIKESIRVISVLWEYQSALKWDWLIQKAAVILSKKVDPENLIEINGMVKGMKAANISTSQDELVALNGYLELIWYWFPSVKDSLKINFPETVKQSCSSFIATGNMTSDHGIVLGHNSMFEYQSPLCNLILDIVPDKGHHILMQAFVGFIHSGTDFFLTDAGLVGSETTIQDFFPYDQNGIPEFSRMRTASQYASSIDEWCKIMEKDNNGGYANSWLLGDVNTNEIARFELGLKYTSLEKKKNGFFTGSNVPTDLRILRFETKFHETDIKGSSVARRVRWNSLMKEYTGMINLELAEKFEADHFDTYLNKELPDSRTLCAHFDLDDELSGLDLPFNPDGTLDGKVLDSKMAKQMSFVARWGSACGREFDAKKFLQIHPQFEWMSGILKNRPIEPWTIFQAGEK